jgi:hypothetical protein
VLYGQYILDRKLVRQRRRTKGSSLAYKFTRISLVPFKDQQIRGSLENCCASASDPKIKLRRIWLLRTHSSPKRLHEQQRRESTGRNGVVKTAKGQSLPQNTPILTEVFGPMWLARGLRSRGNLHKHCASEVRLITKHSESRRRKTNRAPRLERNGSSPV